MAAKKKQTLKSGLRPLNAGESYTYNRKTGEASYFTEKNGKKENVEPVSGIVGFASPSPKAKLTKITIGNQEFNADQREAADVALAQLNRRNKYIADAIAQGKTKEQAEAEIKNMQTGESQPTTQTAEQTITPKIGQKQPTTDTGLTQVEIDQALLQNKMTHPYKEGFEKVTGYKNLAEEFGSRYDPNMHKPTHAEASSGIYQMLDALTSKIGLKGALRSIKVPDTYSTIHDHWANEVKLLDAQIESIKQGKANKQEVIAEMVNAQNAVIQLEGWVHGLGREDPAYLIDEGASWESDLRIIERKYDQYIQDVLDAQVIYQQTQQAAQMQQQQAQNLYGGNAQ